MYESNHGRRLSFSSPAANFNEALPIGNGRLGAMVYGRVDDDLLTLNDDRLWAGVQAPDPVADGPEVLARALALFVAGERKAAQELLERSFTTAYNQPGQPAGALHLAWEGAGEVEEYRRDLDLSSAVAGVHVSRAGVTRSGEHLVSVDEQVLAVRYTATGGRLPTLHLSLDAELRHVCDIVRGDLILRGTLPTHVRWTGVDDLATPENTVTYDERSRGWAVGVRVTETDGVVTAGGASLTVTDATELTVLVAIADDHRGSDHVARVRADLDAGSADSFTTLRARHVARHRELFDRTRIDLPTSHEVPVDTPERLRAHHEGAFDPDLLALTSDLGRYLLISSSRPGSMPANLQGVWNESTTPPWWCNYTLNINLQMNYWPAAATGLDECLEPLLAFAEELAVHGRETARIQYGARGWVAHHQADGHFQSTPVGWRPQGPIPNSAQWALWPFGGVWLAVDLLGVVEVTGDTAFRDRAYRLALGAAEFLLDWLVDDPDDPTLLATFPSTSPENTYLYRGERIAVAKSSTMDIALTRALFTSVLATATEVTSAGEARTIGEDEQGTLDRIAAALLRLPEPGISADGRILEYDQDWPEGEHPHRHISHVWDLCPGDWITVRGTPELAGAVERALDARGDSGTGWSLAWKARARARLQQPEHALRMLNQLLTPVDSSVFDWADDGGGTYPNLLMACPPFMIEANFGYVSALQELFVQDHAGVIDLLPACPKELSTGRIEGVRLRGGLRLDLSWVQGRVVVARIVANEPTRRDIRIDGRVVGLDLLAGENDVSAALLGG